jgi:hypothetical protein
MFGANLTLKVWMLVLRSQARVVYGSLQLRGGDVVYYDQFYDVAAPNRGWFLTNDLDVLWQSSDGKFVGGARYTLTIPFYGSGYVRPGEAAADNSMHRIGPFLAYTFFSKDGASFNNPTVFLLAQWWAKHRYRSGQEVNAGLPLIGLGFQMTGDFLPVPAPATRARPAPPPAATPETGKPLAPTAVPEAPGP